MSPRSSTSARPSAARRARRRWCSPTCWRASCELPVFLYGVLAGGRTRAELRRGGIAKLAAPHRRRRADARLRAARPHPRPAWRWSPRGRRSWRSTSSSQPPATSARRGDRGGDPRGRAEGLPGLRAIGIELHTREARPGVDERRGPSACRWRRSSRRSPVTPTSRRRDRRARSAGRVRGIPRANRDPRLRHDRRSLHRQLERVSSSSAQMAQTNASAGPSTAATPRG